MFYVFLSIKLFLFRAIFPSNNMFISFYLVFVYVDSSLRTKAQILRGRIRDPGRLWTSSLGRLEGRLRRSLISLLGLSLLNKIRRLKLSGEFPMGLGIPPLNIKIMLGSNPLKSRILVGRLAIHGAAGLGILPSGSWISAGTRPACQDLMCSSVLFLSITI